MKKTITTLCLTAFLLLGINPNVSGQGMPVYDNTNFISLAKSLIESAKQTSQLLKTVEFLKKQKENIERVNNVLKQIKAVKELAKNNKILLKTVQGDLKKILHSPYIKPEEVTRISDSFNSIIENSLDDLDFINKILTSDYFKMSDAERAQVLRERELQSKEMVVEIRLKTKRYQDIISFREMQDKINNRTKNY
jgi:hypothetical protein